MIVVPFIDVHLEGFEEQESQKISDKEANQLAMEISETYSLIHDGKVIAFAGIIEKEYAFVLLSKYANKHLFSITKLINNFIKERNFDTLKMIVKCDFEQGKRWARILKFKELKQIESDGQIYNFYTR